MAGAPSSDTISTRLQKIAEQARTAPDMVFANLAHNLDFELLKEAFRRTRKDGAVGVDGKSAKDYTVNLEDNLRDLWSRARTGTYKAPPVRRVHIPKGDKAETTRPIGIPSFEDKVLQRGVTMILEAVYEQDFYDCSFGFRPGRSAHQAISRLWNGLMELRGGWVLEVDIRGYFDSIDHKHLRDILDLRVRDRGIRRLIGKWLQAGVLEAGVLSMPEAGTPQGGVASPLLANIYLHEVLDKWFHEVVKPRLHGPAFLVRYADDFVIVFSTEADARRVQAVLSKRFGRFGLELHEGKTRLLPFRMPPRSVRGKTGMAQTFDFLGFTHYWARSLKSAWVVKQKTAKSRLSRALRKVDDWCRLHRHHPARDQQQMLSQKVRGHYGYFGITGNYRALLRFLRQVKRTWIKWLNRRSRDAARRTWKDAEAFLKRHPLPPPRIVRRNHAANP